MSLVKLVVTTTRTTTTTHDRTIHRPIESRARPRRDSTPCRGRGSRMGWGGVESSRDRSISPEACTSRDHAMEIRGRVGIYNKNTHTFGYFHTEYVRMVRGGDVRGM